MDLIVASTTPRFVLTATKDGSVWDLTGATVTITFRKPDGTTTSATATITDASAGTARYDAPAATFTQSGAWRRSWTVTQSGVTLESTPILFYVEDSP